MDDTPAGALSCGVAMFRPQWTADPRPGPKGVPLRNGGQARMLTSDAWEEICQSRIREASRPTVPGYGRHSELPRETRATEGPSG
jgi:hypothetical protein